MAKPRHIRLGDVSHHFTPGQRAAISSANHPNFKQRFYVAIRTRTGGKPVQPGQIRHIVQSAVKTALFKPVDVLPKTKRRRNAGALLAQLRKTHWSRTWKEYELNRELLKWLPETSTFLFPKGKANFVAEAAFEIGGFNVAPPAARVLVKPALDAEKEKEISETLDYHSPRRDVSESLRGSIGHATLKFHTEHETGKSVMVVWNIQPRALDIPTKFRNRFYGWESMMMEYLEEVARKAGASKIAVIGPKHIDHMGLQGPRENREARRENVKRNYRRLIPKFRRAGFTRQHLSLKGVNYQPDVISRGKWFFVSKPRFLVKELN